MKRGRIERSWTETGNKLKRHGAAIGAILLLTAGSLPAANAQTYSYLDLGTLGGTQAGAYGVNASGQVVGWSNTPGDASIHATLWTGGGAIDLGTLSGHTASMAFGINDGGQVVGRSIGSGTFRATLWNGGTATDMGLGNNSTASAINNSGQVATTSFNPAPGQSQLWSGGSATNLFQTSFLRPGINDAGQVVGESANQAVVSSGGVTTNLGALPGSVFGYAYAINDAGQAVGDSVFCGACNDRATLWDAGAAVDLGTLGGADSLAVDINNDAQIVGSSTTLAGGYHAALWSSGALFDLNSFLAASAVASGVVLREAGGINDSGWIVGTAFNALSGLSNAYLLMPITNAVGDPDGTIPGAVAAIPEPETYAMLLAGLALLGWAGRRRERATRAAAAAAGSGGLADSR